MCTCVYYDMAEISFHTYETKEMQQKMITGFSQHVKFSQSGQMAWISAAFILK